MCLAEDLDIPMYYQDTDSIHMNRDCVDKLATEFKTKYENELIGKQLGQFHSDFDLKGSDGEVFSTESIFLGKKSYIDHLACSGNDTSGYHKRMKGIPSKLLTGWDIYEDLYHGQEKSFDLTECCSIAIDSKTQTITKRTSFYRTVKF